MPGSTPWRACFLFNVNPEPLSAIFFGGGLRAALDKRESVLSVLSAAVNQQVHPCHTFRPDILRTSRWAMPLGSAMTATQFADEYWAFRLANRHFISLMMGDVTHLDQWNDFSEEGTA